MAHNSAKAAKMARVFAIVHIIVGFLLICFGIADGVVQYFWTGYIGFGVWTGVWMCITGGLGIPGTRKEQTRSRNIFAGIFMGFSITSAVFGGIIAICYGISITVHKDDCRSSNSYYSSSSSSRCRSYDAEMALTAIILILGIVEFTIGIWAVACLCLMKPCTSPQQGQVIYSAITGHAMIRGPGTAPVAIPMQRGGGMVAVQNVPPWALGGQPQMVLVPVSGAEGYQPHLAQGAPTGVINAGYQPQQVEMPPPYEQGQNMPQQSK